MKVLRLFIILILFYCANSLASDEYPLINILNTVRADVEKLENGLITQEEAEQKAIEHLSQYKKSVEPHAGWSLLPDSQDIVFSFPSAMDSAGAFLGPVRETFVNHGYSFVALNFSCNLHEDYCSQSNLERDFLFAYELSKLLGKRLNFFGYSAGGALATYAASRLSTEVEKLFLMSPGLKLTKYSLGINLASLACTNESALMPSGVANALKGKTPEKLVKLACEFNRLWKKQGQRYFQADPVRAMGKDYSEYAYASITAETYLIYAKEDQFVSSAEMDYLKKNVPHLAGLHIYDFGRQLPVPVSSLPVQAKMKNLGPHAFVHFMAFNPCENDINCHYDPERDNLHNLNSRLKRYEEKKEDPKFSKLIEIIKPHATVPNILDLWLSR